MYAMQNWLDKFCRKHPRFAIPNLMMYLAVGSAIVALLDQFSMGASASALLYFDRGLILQGEIWRLITFVFVPIGGLFNSLIAAYFYYFIGTALEREWGSAKFTIYYGFGMLLNILLGFLIGFTSVTYLNLALFFAFATLYPEMRILLFFIIPVKVKWLAWIDAVIFAGAILLNLFGGNPLAALIPIVAILNYLLFFSGDLLAILRRSQQKTAHRYSRQTVDFKKATQQAKEKKGYLHKCAVCGKTDVTNPELEFRYCSRCNGYHCYCQDHINAHVHIE